MTHENSVKFKLQSMKLYRSIAVLICLYAAFGCFPPTTAESCSCKRDCMCHSLLWTAAKHNTNHSGPAVPQQQFKCHMYCCTKTF